MKLKIDTSYESLNKAGEEICGNVITVMRDQQGLTALFSDGGGDGTRASITSAFVTRMAAFLLRNGESATGVVRAIADTYSDKKDPAKPAPGVAVVRVNAQGEASYAAINMPLPILIKRGKLVKIEFDFDTFGTKLFVHADFRVEKNSMLILYNEAILQCGRSCVGWNDSVINSYLQSAYKPVNYTAKKVARLLINAADSLEQGMPKHDISVLTLHALDEQE